MDARPFERTRTYANTKKQARRVRGDSRRIGGPERKPKNNIDQPPIRAQYPSETMNNPNASTLKKIEEAIKTLDQFCDDRVQREDLAYIAADLNNARLNFTEDEYSDDDAAANWDALETLQKHLNE